ncbi:NfeD family protein [Bacteroidota bacterium]
MTGIILLILLGILLFLVEFLLVPGITIAGIGGLVLTVFGVYKAFTDFGPETGAWVLAATIVVSILVIAFSLRAKTWRKFMLNTSVKGSVKENLDDDSIKEGEKGIALTRLAPIGKVNIHDDVREAKSIEGYIDAHKPVEVVRVEGKTILVRTIKE